MIIWRPKEEIEERSAAIRRDFARRYDLDDLREQLYREQEGVCGLCKNPMQISCSVVCVVDHAISVFLYATWDYTIEKACELANHKQNLLLAHIACNVVKKATDIEDFTEALERGEISLGEVPTLTPEKIQELKASQSERGRKGVLNQPHKAKVAGGRKGGPIGGKATNATTDGRKGNGGRKHVESGHLASLRTPEHQRKAATASGRKNVESGHIQALGRVQGRKNVENGRLRLQGLKNVESGQVATLLHIRWHVRRNIVNPECALCMKTQ